MRGAAERERKTRSKTRETWESWVLAAAMLLSAATILVLSRQFWFYGDELDWLAYGRDFELRTLLTPHGSHLIAIPRLIYEGFPRLFGVDYLPFRLLVVAAVLAIGWFFFQLMRERVGAPFALVPTLVVLFFGSASDIVLTPQGTPFLLAIAFGLAALFVVERTPRWWQPTACLLLALSILSHTFGVIFAAGILVYLVLTPSLRRGAWAAVLPIVAWVIWWRWAAQFEQSITDGSNVIGAPIFVVEALGAAIQAATGFGPYFGEFDLIADVAKAAFLLIAVLAIALIAFRIVAGLSTPWLWAYLVLGVGFWLAIGLAEGEGRHPDSPRYLLFGAIIVFLLAAEALRDARVPDQLRRIAIYAGVALAVVAVGANAARLVALSPGIEEAGADTRAQIAATRLAAELVDPGSSIKALGPPASPYAAAPVGWLLEFEDEVGALGYSLDELRRQPEDVRARADYVLSRQQGVRMGATDLAELGRGMACINMHPQTDGYTRVELKQGFNFLSSGGSADRGAVPVEVGRFADEPSVELGTLPQDRRTTAGAILIPADDVLDPWVARVPGPVSLCHPLTGDGGQRSKPGQKPGSRPGAKPGSSRRS